MPRINKATAFVTQGAVIAALYVALTMLSQALGLTSLTVQLRFSEALCVLPLFTSAAVPGLTIGCVLANLLLASAPWDTVFGSFATFLGAIVCFYASRELKRAGKRRLAILLSPIPNVLSNTLILPFIIKWVYFDEMSIPLIALLVLAGEAASCAPGIPLAFALERRSKQIFG